MFGISAALPAVQNLLLLFHSCTWLNFSCSFQKTKVRVHMTLIPESEGTCLLKPHVEPDDINGKFLLILTSFVFHLLCIQRDILSSSSGRCWLKKQLQHCPSLNIREIYSHTSSKMSGLFTPNKLWFFLIPILTVESYIIN